MGYTGQCACGAVRLTINAPALTVRQCWCRQCQQIAAGGATHNAIFKDEDVTITGTLGTQGYTAASGNRLELHFCPSCGCHVSGQSAARRHLRVVRLGAINQPHDLRPRAIIWTDDAPEWAVFDPALEQFPGQPPAPPPPAS